MYSPIDLTVALLEADRTQQILTNLKAFLNSRDCYIENEITITLKVGFHIMTRTILQWKMMLRWESLMACQHNNLIKVMKLNAPFIFKEFK